MRSDVPNDLKNTRGIRHSYADRAPGRILHHPLHALQGISAPGSRVCQSYKDRPPPCGYVVRPPVRPIRHRTRLRIVQAVQLKLDFLTNERAFLDDRAIDE